MKTEELTPDELHTIQWMQRPRVLTPTKAKESIEELEEYIMDLRERIKNATSQIEKNNLYHRIEGHQIHIKYFNQFL